MLRAYLGLIKFASEYIPGSKYLQIKRQETFKKIYPLLLIEGAALQFKWKFLTNTSVL